MARQRLTARLLLFAFLALPVGGAASHYCFDGQEPPVSVHFDNFSGHEEHGESEQHVDVEKRMLAEHLVSKFFDSEVFLPASLSPGDAFAVVPVPDFNRRPRVSGRIRPWSLSPPLRAPPILS